MTRTSRSRQRGSALIAAVALTAIMAVLGLATLGLVSGQMVASSRERTADGSFNLAESVAHLQVAAFSHSWPASLPLECDGVISAGELAEAEPGCVPPGLVAASLAGVDLTGASWAVRADDAGGGRIRLRVSASTVGPEATDRAVEALVDKRSAQALPAGYVIIANAFSGELGIALNSVSNVAILQQMLGNHKLIRDGKIGLRCNLIHGPITSDSDPNTCVMGALGLSGPSGMPGIPAIIGPNALTNYGHPSAATPAVMGALRARAEEAGTMREQVAHGAACFDGPMTADTVVFVEQVGAGDGTCTVDLPVGTTTEVGAVVVNRGRLLIRGVGEGTLPGVLRGVVWAMNGQQATSGDIIRLAGAVQVRGMVVVDGFAGTVGLRPSPNDATATQIQADSMAEEVNEAYDALAGLTQAQFDLAASRIAGVEADRALVAAARNATPYPERNCSQGQRGPDHQELRNRLGDLANSLQSLMTGIQSLPGIDPYVTQLASLRASVLAERDALPHPAPCQSATMEAILAGAFDGIDEVLGGIAVTLSANGGLLGYLQSLPITLEEQWDTKKKNLGQLLTNPLGAITSDGMVIYDAEAVGRLRVEGAAGMVADSFRQIPVG
jgi:hypothetical protein